MKTLLLKFGLPVGLGLTLLIITAMGLVSTTLVGCEKDDSTTKHCTKAGYPLYCSTIGTCCPAGYPYYCDGNCHSSACPSGTVTVDSCSPE